MARREVSAWIKSLSKNRKEKLFKGFIKENEEAYNKYVEDKYDSICNKSTNP